MRPRGSAGSGASAAQALPPWWILNKITPDGPKKDMGTWKAYTFSKEQQSRFGVNEMGEVLDQKKFDAAIATLKAARTGALALIGEARLTPMPRLFMDVDFEKIARCNRF